MLLELLHYLRPFPATKRTRLMKESWFRDEFITDEEKHSYLKTKENNLMHHIDNYESYF